MGADMDYAISTSNTYTLHSSTVLEFTGNIPHQSDPPEPHRHGETAGQARFREYRQQRRQRTVVSGIPIRQS
jgi:hypothetical protein